MKKNNAILAMACAAGIFLSACNGTGTKKERNFNNYTGTDTEAFNFLKKSHYEARFQLFVAKDLTDAALAKELTDFYTQFAEEVEKIATADHVLVPSPGDAPFTNTAAEVPTPSDSSSVAVVDYFEKPLNERIILSQEEILHQTENAVSNTNVRIREYAREVLPTIESLLEKTKAALK